MTKPDLLTSCNDQGMRVDEFRQTFCKHCRQPECSAAGWARDLFADRVSTQVERLLIRPNFAPDDALIYDPVRSKRFLPIAEAVEVRSDWSREALASAPVISPPTPAPSQPATAAGRWNTAMPAGGVMLDGSPAPPRAPGAPAVDPWAPKPIVNVVPKGAKVRMGG